MPDETATGTAAPRPPGADHRDLGRGDRGDLTPFQRAVVDAVGSLHPGEVVTYGDIASQAGSPAAAQAVANVLRQVDGLPWWRVVPSDGRLYRTHAAVQAPLLRAEGVLVDDERRVDAPGAVTHDAAALARALAFERRCYREVADRTVPLEWGEVVDTPGAAHVFDHTFLAVDADVEAGDVLAALDEHLPDAPSPRVRVQDQRAAARLVPALRARGWQAGQLVICRWTGPPPPAAPDVRVLDVEDLAAWTRGVQPRHAWSTPAAVDDSVRILRRLDEVVGLRGVGAVGPDGRLHGACRVYEGFDVAQVEEVEVLAEHRGEGVGRRVVTAAVRAALGAWGPAPHTPSALPPSPGTLPRMVFLVAAADDWPLVWYRRLGFAEVGRCWVLTRRS